MLEGLRERVSDCRQGLEGLARVNQRDHCRLPYPRSSGLKGLSDIALTLLSPLYFTPLLLEWGEKKITFL